MKTNSRKQKNIPDGGLTEEEELQAIIRLAKTLQNRDITLERAKIVFGIVKEDRRKRMLAALEEQPKNNE